MRDTINLLDSEDLTVWQYLEGFLAQYVKVRPKHALRIYRATAREAGQDTVRNLSDQSLAESILQKGINNDNKEIMEFARDVTQEIAELSENQSLIDILHD